MANRTYAPQIPFTLDQNDNIVNINDPLKNCKQLLRMLVLTNPGEKIMDPLFGVGVRKLLFENNIGVIEYQYSSNSVENIKITDFQSVLDQKIRQQAAKYAPDLYISSIVVSAQNDILYLSIYYNYKGYLADALEMQIS
jgi:hypothetical protein